MTAPVVADRQQRLILLIAILSSFVSFLDGTVVTVALPAIQRELGGGLATQQWVMDAYLITLGALILLAGSLSDIFGRMRVLRAGLIGFGIASVAAAVAPDPGFLIAARAVQGVAGALLVPSSLAMIASAFTGAAYARAIGTWTGATTVASLVGPVLGGVFVDLVSWRLVFLINVLPIAVTLWLAASIRQPEHERGEGSVDWLGAGLVTAGLGGVVFALIEQGNLGWSSPAVWVTLLVGALCLAGFLVRQRTARDPMMPLTMFRNRNFSAGNLATWFIYAALSLNGFALSVYLQQGAGLTATLAGLASLPAMAIMIAFSSLVGGWGGRLGPRMFMTVGPLIMAVGVLLLLTVSPAFDYWWQVLPSVLLFGIGLTLTVAPLTAAVLGTIERRHAGIASATNNAVARVAGLVAVAALGIIAGGSLDLGGFHRSALVMAALLAIGGVISLIGIRNPPDATAER